MRILIASPGFSEWAIAAIREAAGVGPADYVVAPHRNQVELDVAARDHFEVIVADQMPSSATPSLRWVQLLSAGVDRVGPSDIWSNHDVQVTNASGVASSAIANHATALILHRMLGLGGVLSTTRGGGWYELDDPVRQAAGQTLGIIGMGSIGSRVAAIGEQLGFRIVAVQRSRNGPGSLRYRPSWVIDLEDERRPHVTFESLDDVLAHSDVLVLAAPATAETRHLIGAHALTKVKPGVIIINVARGSLIDEAGLVTALERGLIAGAGLDVTEPEPPAEDSPLRQLANVDLTPHMAGWFEGYYDIAADLVSQNLRRYRAGLPLFNVLGPGVASIGTTYVEGS